MDRARTGGSFFRCVTPIFLFIRSRDLWRNGGKVGDFFLQLRAAQCFRRALIHAGCPFAQSRPPRAIFLAALDRERETDIVSRIRDRNFIGSTDQIAECDRRGADFVSGLAEMALEFFETSVALASRCDYNFTFGCLVLACLSNR